jgi:methionyl aminopeptidase
VSTAVQELNANAPCWCGSGRKYKRCHRLSDLGEGAGTPAKPPRTRGRITPGLQTALRAVPSEITRPPYAAGLGMPTHRDAGLPRSEDVIARMRVAGRAAAEVLRTVGEAVAVGVTTDELDRIVHEACLARGGYPSPLGYGSPPYPKSCCTSVNEVICHGIPDSTALVDGDLVNVDVTIFLDGVHGDTNATFLVGEVDQESARLVTVTRQCLDKGIEAVRPGGRLRDIGAAISDHAHAHGFSVVRSFVGHGIAEQFHAEPTVQHYYDPQATRVLEPGMTFTIEPMINVGSWRHAMWDDQWTAVTVDGKRSAQFEHTVLVTDEGVEVLTR